MKKFKFLTLSITLSFAILFSLTSCIGQTPDKTPSKTNQNNSQTQKEEQESDLLLQSFTFTVQEAPEKITELDSGNYAIKVTGTITADDIEEIRDAMLTDDKRYIALDLSETTGLTKLEDNAFFIEEGIIDHKGAPLLSLKLPDTVIEIGEYCFWNCNHMKSITAPGVKTLKPGAFYVCSALTSYTLAEELDLIDELAFAFCYKLPEVTLNAKVIGNKVTYSDRALRKIIIGSAVEEIENGAFEEQDALEKFEISEENTRFKVEDGILYSFDKTRLVHYPEARKGTEFTIPDTVQSIDEAVFSHCKNLTKVTLPNITELPERAFTFASSLKEVAIPSVKSIQGQAFSYCKALQVINLPDTLTFIGFSAFNEATNLNSIYIPKSVTTIESDVFNSWQATQTINCEAEAQPSGWDTYWARYDWIDDSKPTIVTIKWGVTR